MSSEAERKEFIEQLEALLRKHGASLRSSCQTGCNIEIWISDKEVIKEYCCEIP